LNSKLKRDQILYENISKIYRTYFIPIPRHPSVEWIPSTKSFKKGDLLVELKLSNRVSRITANTAGELIELRDYAILYRECSKVDEVSLKLQIPGYNKLRNQKEIKQNIERKFPHGIMGNSFKQNEVILSSKSDYYYQVSPISGKVVNFDQEDCTLKLKRTKRIDRITSYASGVISKIEPENISIHSLGSRIMGIHGLGEEVSGCFGKEIMLISSREDLDEFCYNDSQGGVVHNLPYQDYQEFKSKLGAKMISKSLIILNGFGEFEKDPDFSALCQELQKYRIHLFPFTRIRAGVVRPFIYYE